MFHSPTQEENVNVSHTSQAEEKQEMPQSVTQQETLHAWVDATLTQITPSERIRLE